MPTNNSDKAKYWMLTIPQHCFTPYQPPGVSYLGGQLERGNDTGYVHWQLICVFTAQVRLSRVKAVFGHSCHAEGTRSEAARAYCFKADSKVDGTDFEFGKYPFRRNERTDWEKVRVAAMNGELTSQEIPAQVFINSYSSLRCIKKDYFKPKMRGAQVVNVFWGKTRTGKTRQVYREAPDVYDKTPDDKWFDGYQGETAVLLDEFRGEIPVSWLLKWLDRYPCRVHDKGSMVPLCTKIWYITSNMDPKDWYPHLDRASRDALFARFTVIKQFT